MNNNKTIAIIGSSGLIGSQLLDLLKNRKDVQEIRLLVRRENGLKFTGIRECVINFEDLNAFGEAINGCDAVFCAIGTTRNKVKGDMSAYRKVDVDIPVHAAQLAAQAGVKAFMLVSSVGANASTSNFYLKFKGEVEDTVRQLNIPNIGFFRPSLLLGPRIEFRMGEKISQLMMRPFTPFIPANYKPIQARQVATAMIHTAFNGVPGVHVLHYKEMQAIKV